jgi:nucleotide-binding universal stress UspA family protein
MSSDTNTSSSYVKNTKEGYSTEPTEVEYSISKSSIPSYAKILVPDDGKEISNKALSHAIYVSNLSGAEIVILRIIEKVDKLGDTSVNISQDGTAMKNDEKDLKRNVEGGHTVEEIVKECEQTNYDLIVMASSHLDSWMRSLFSDARKIMSNINTPVLIVH